MVTPVATLGTGIRSSYRRPSCDMRIRRTIVVMLLIADKNMPELVLAISSGDSPQVDKWKLLQHSDGVVPVLMFGSSFHDTNVYKWSRCQCHCRVSIRIASFNGRNPMENNCARVYVWCLVKRKICNGIC